jgi:hypothetical protein
MQPRTYIAVIALTLGLLVPGWLGLVVATANAPTISSTPLCALLAEKRRISVALPSDRPRLFLVAGSSAHFGLSAAQIEADLGLATVNYGTHGGLTMRVMLEDVRRLVRPGDTVLLAPEYGHYSRGPLNEVLVDYLYACAVEDLRALPLAHQIESAFALEPARVAAGIAARLGFPGLAERLAYLNLPLPLGERYSAAIEIGPRGDALINRRVAITPKLQGRVADFAALPLAFTPDSDGVQALAEFARWAAAQRVRVLATWPNTLDFPAYREPGPQAFFVRLAGFYGELGVPILGAPEDALLPAEDFYDTNYHLHDEAVARRTAALVPLLRAASVGAAK